LLGVAAEVFAPALAPMAFDPSALLVGDVLCAPELGVVVALADGCVVEV
jgi:hypothetical protein